MLICGLFLGVVKHLFLWYFVYLQFFEGIVVFPGLTGKLGSCNQCSSFLLSLSWVNNLLSDSFPICSIRYKMVLAFHGCHKSNKEYATFLYTQREHVSHCSQLRWSRCSQFLNSINKHQYITGPTPHLLDIYYALICTVLEYCCVIWRNSLRKYL